MVIHYILTPSPKVFSDIQHLQVDGQTETGANIAKTDLKAITK